MSLVTSVKKVVRDRLIARAGGIDLSRLDKVPDALSWPLKRDAVAPGARLVAMRDEDPVQKLASLLGLDVWLVTGDVESRQVLSDTTSYSTDIRPYMGKRGSVTEGDFGGLGFTDPPDHTKLRRLLMPEFTMRRLERIRPAISSIVEKQIAEIEAAGLQSEVVDLVPTFAFPIPFLVICDLLGLPDEKRETFSKLATARFDISQGAQSSMAAVGGSREFLLAETARQRNNPGPGLIGQIIREHGDEINDFDLGGLADGVFTGGAPGEPRALEPADRGPGQCRSHRRRPVAAALRRTGRIPSFRQARRGDRRQAHLGGLGHRLLAPCGQPGPARDRR